MDLFGDMAAILNSTVSNTHYGTLRGQILTNLPPGNPRKAIGNNRIKNSRPMAKKVYRILSGGISLSSSIDKFLLLVLEMLLYYEMFFLATIFLTLLTAIIIT